MTSIVETVFQYLNRGEPVVLATIIRQQGATPRKAGTRMVVAPDGRFHGTIGGGLLEARVVDRARAMLPDAPACIERFDLDSTDAAAMDLICGGGLEVLYDPLRPTPETIAVFQRRAQWDPKARSALFITLIRRRGEQVSQIHHALVAHDGRVHGTLPVDDAVLQEARRAAAAAGAMTTLTMQDGELLLEPIRPPWRAIVVGAGHVAQPTAHLAALVDFQVTVLDDRAAFANQHRFPDAHRVAVVPDFANLFRNLPVDRHTFIIIVTRGHLHDQAVLAQALRTPAGYIGMIGSRRKRDAIYGRLLEQGVAATDLDRVHCPIGLEIAAETPTEIAVSIVAEMITARRRPTAHPNGEE
ncbi:XdhC family aldehyde oxidoreductase maturation factor [Desulfatitalea alkaliphila]|uniref:XdhC family protein n=1 Tax=Desulfatitalea alkaliphila TaxID=2929485 RepID=A0AA41UHB2_9BACT|nr:XdhC family protein [Desulfatitalea alkaliphila]